MPLEYAIMIYRYVHFQRNAHGNKPVSFVPPSQAGDVSSVAKQPWGWTPKCNIPAMLGLLM